MAPPTRVRSPSGGGGSDTCTSSWWQHGRSWSRDVVARVRRARVERGPHERSLGTAPIGDGHLPADRHRGLHHAVAGRRRRDGSRGRSPRELDRRGHLGSPRCSTDRARGGRQHGVGLSQRLGCRPRCSRAAAPPRLRALADVVPAQGPDRDPHRGGSPPRRSQLRGEHHHSRRAHPRDRARRPGRGVLGHPRPRRRRSSGGRRHDRPGSASPQGPRPSGARVAARPRGSPR